MIRSGAALALGLATLVLSGCEIGAKETVQRGYRGTGMEVLYDKSELAKQYIRVAGGIPAPPPAAAIVMGSAPFRNVRVLTDVSAPEMLRTMLAMSTAVTGAPGNCAYCHNVAAPWDDTLPNGKEIYTKIVARRMLQMVRHVNSGYQSHVGNTGVTCYTCHLGNPQPKGLWFYEGPNQIERYFLDRAAVRIQTHQVAASNDNRSSVKQTEYTYALMIRLSKSLGVSCSYCHNTRAFESWHEAPPQRATAYLGASMVRDLNQHYLSPLAETFPASRKGPQGDSPKLQCSTCHNGVYKPLYGYPMAKDYPAFWGRPAWNGHAFPAPIPDTTTAAGLAAYRVQQEQAAVAVAASLEPIPSPATALLAHDSAAGTQR